MHIKSNKLDGRVALVTGARRGIGRAIARRLSAEGAAVVVAALSIDDEGVDETVELIEASGGKVARLAFDLSDETARGDAIARAKELFGPINILVNNGAVNNYESASQMDLAYRRFMFEVNFHAPVDLIQQALPDMLERSWGRIINIASDTINQPPLPYPRTSVPHIHGMVVYGASKAALVRYTQGLSAELRYTGVHVNSFYPHKVCVTETNSETALAVLRGRPDWAESVDVMAEAAYVLTAGSFTGVVGSSRDILQMVQQPLHDISGRNVNGDAATLPSLD